MLAGQNITKTIGGTILYKNAGFQIYAGEKVGLVGPNGMGKTTLFRIITNEVSPDEGQIVLEAHSRMSYFSQNVGQMKGKKAIEEVIEGDESVTRMKNKLSNFEAQLTNPDLSEKAMNQILEEMGEVQTEFERCGGYDLESRAEEILTGLGMAPEDHHKMVEEFSGGFKMRIALAKALVTNPDLIIMDEPTNYLDLETILWLERWLKTFKGSIFMTTHDRDFMNNVVNKVIEVFDGKLTTYSGNYDFYLQEKQIRRKQNEAEYKRQQDMLAKEEEFIARFKARASHAAQVQSRVKKLEKIEKVTAPAQEQTIKFEFPNPLRGGNDVAIIENLGKSWINSLGKEHDIFENLSVTIHRKSKVAVVGVNGAGKSTLLKVISGETAPSYGSVKIGASIQIGYFGQSTLENLNENHSIFDEVRFIIKDVSDGYIRNLLAAFLFRAEDVEKKIKYLSGGEKARLILAILLAQRNNFLILDEPTNHLDIQSREVLLKALLDYEGTVLFVSHDRFFLNALAQQVFEVNKGVIHIYPGAYQEYLLKKAADK